MADIVAVVENYIYTFHKNPFQFFGKYTDKSTNKRMKKFTTIFQKIEIDLLKTFIYTSHPNQDGIHHTLPQDDD